MKRSRMLVIGAVIAAPILLGAGSCDNKAVNADRAKMNDQLQRYQDNQPNPTHDWSQYRQGVQDIESAQVHGVATTSFFFNQGSVDPVRSCSSIGYPIPSTAQVTSPWMKMDGFDAVIPQIEPNGVFTGDSQGTYVLCVWGTKKVPTYWEGNVESEGGPAHWDRETKMIVPDGDPNVTVTDKK